MDTGEDTGDAVLNFTGETQVEWSIKGADEFTTDKYELSLLKTPSRLKLLNLWNRTDTFRIHVHHFDFLILSPLRRLEISSRAPNRNPRSTTPNHRLEAFSQSPKTSALGPIPLDWAPSLLATVAFGPCHR